jgi:hypothetical protein
MIVTVRTRDGHTEKHAAAYVECTKDTIQFRLWLVDSSRADYIDYPFELLETVELEFSSYEGDTKLKEHLSSDDLK